MLFDPSELPTATLPTSDQLRQGDLCRADVFPQWRIDKEYRVEGPQNERWVQLPDIAETDKVAQPDDTGVLVCVCSHDCELENPRRRSGIILAPVMQVPAKEGDDRYETIVKSAYPSEGSSGTGIFVYDFINYFPIKVSGGACKGVWVVDLAIMAGTGPARDVVPILIEGRSHSLEVEGRKAFRDKLGAFLARPPG